MAHTSLTSLFSDIADAIRAKTGGTAQITADSFPTAIAAISTLRKGTSTVTPSANSKSAAFNNMLGNPKYFFCFAKADVYDTGTSNTYFAAIWYDGTNNTQSEYGYKSSNYAGARYLDNADGTYITKSYSSANARLTLTGKSSVSRYFKSGVTYELIYFY